MQEYKSGDIDKSNAIEKALRILTTFLPDNRESGTVEISHKLGFHKATVSRILQILANEGYLRQNPDTRKFTLGETVVRLGNAALSSSRKRRLTMARPYLESLRDRSGQTVTMEVLIGDETLLACFVGGPRPVHVGVEEGNLLPWNGSAGLRAMLAFSPESVVRRFLSKPIIPLSPRALNTHEQYLEELKLTRSRGYAADRGGITMGFTALSVPVYGASGWPECSIILVGPDCDMERSEAPYVALLKETASRMSKELFYDESAAETPGDSEEM